MFPIRDSRGRVLGFGGRVIDQGEPKYLNSPETPLFHKGRELYGLYEARQARADFKRLMIVEGYMDVVRLHQAGITYAVATLGTATTQEHLHKIFRLTSELVFCFDGDRAGLQAAWRALENALPLARDGRELKFMFLPEGHDPDTLVAAEGAEAFESATRSARCPCPNTWCSNWWRRWTSRTWTAAPSSPRWRRRCSRACPTASIGNCSLDRLAAEIRMPAAKLKEHLPAAGARRRPGAPRATRAGARGTNRAEAQSDERRAGQSAEPGHHVWCCITPRRRARSSDPRRLPVSICPGIAVLKELLEQAAGMEQPSTAMLLERWRDRPEYARLTELAMARADGGRSAAAPPRSCKWRSRSSWRAIGPGRRMDELLRKAEEMGLNYDEKTELSLLLKAKVRPGGTVLSGRTRSELYGSRSGQNRILIGLAFKPLDLFTRRPP